MDTLSHVKFKQGIKKYIPVDSIVYLSFRTLQIAFQPIT